MEEIQKAPSTLKKIKANTQKSVAKFSKEQYAMNVESVYKDAIVIYNESKQKEDNIFLDNGGVVNGRHGWLKINCH